MSIPYLLALHSINGINSKKLALLIEYFGGAEAAFAQIGSWQDIPELAKDFSALFEAKKEVDLNRVYEDFLASGAKILTIEDNNYPELLREIYDPPYLLFYLGDLPLADQLYIAVIGARNATAYGKQVANNMAAGLASQGAWVVSGLARGIDAAAHKGAMTTGKTLAVLATGIDVVYPRENKELFEQVVKNGAVISEMPIGTKPLAYHFPLRNRIISGLCKGLVVVEATKKSGTKHTVDHALEQGRDIFAVPGPVFSPLSQGTHSLIRQQCAKLVENADDVMEEYRMGHLFAEPRFGKQGWPKQDNLTMQEKHLCEFLIIRQHFDKIAAELELSSAELAPLLVLWELRGLIKQLPGNNYVMNQ